MPSPLAKTLLILVLLTTSAAAHADDAARREALAALKKSVTFFREQVGHQGAYLYRYSNDLKRQEGEHDAYATTGWTQPPGAPSVGAAYLNAYVLTGEPFLLEAARETADALIRGQLRSGGWYYKFELDPKHRARYAYRIAPNNPKGRNHTTLDDNKTQSTVMFLMRLDETLKFQDRRLNEAVRYALDQLVAAQYPNGAWPQQFTAPPDAEKHPVVAASYPAAWSRKYEGKDYRGHYTFNDNAMSDMIDVLLEADRIYDEPRYGAAARKTGGFMLLAQMPEPQPGWAQQYDAKMHPAWARKFEPAGLTGGESQGVMRALLKLAEHTGERRFLKPIPKAVAYYRRSLLPDGRLSRFYELKTNRPLYFTTDYQLTYDDGDLPTHYGFKVSSGLDSIERKYKSLVAREPGEKTPLRDWRPRRRQPSRAAIAAARDAIAAMDRRGAWVEMGVMRTYPGGRPEKVITSKTFIDKITTLSRVCVAE